MSAYAVVTNLPNPKIDIENDKGDWLSGDTDDNYEESEAACMSPTSLIAGKQYFMTTYWFDYRAGAENDSGRMTATPEMSRDFPTYDGDLNPTGDRAKSYSLYYGANGGYR